jgi:hypothetical protein
MKDYAYVICLIPALAILRRQKELLAPVAAFLVLAPSLSSYVLFPMMGGSTLFRGSCTRTCRFSRRARCSGCTWKELRRDPIR